MTEYVSTALRRLIRSRAGDRCEYCLTHEEDCLLPHEPDHIIATKHQGATTEDNLAWTCFVCNRAKGSDLGSIDSDSGQLVRLFSPRKDRWQDHFAVTSDGKIVPHTDVARVTIRLLKMNRPELVELRRTLINAGLFEIPNNETT